MDVVDILRAKWYPFFAPKIDTVKSFKTRAWKILVINSGTTPGKPLLCQRYGDGKKHHFSFKEIEEGFLTEDNFIRYAQDQGYQLVDKKEGILKFESLKSKP